MSAVVIDASVALSWLLPDESILHPSRVQQFVASDGAVVPSIWHLEIANALLVAVRRGRIDRDFREGALGDFAALPISVDDETLSRAWVETLELADAHELSAYDASYLELAIRRSLPLFTLDRKLGAAARSLGLPEPV